MTEPTAGDESKTQSPSPPDRGSRLPPGQLRRYLRDLPGWQLAPEGRQIVRRLAFPSAVSCLIFVYIVLELATETAREPFVDIRGKTLRVILGGHGEEGVTWADLDLARRINLEG